MKLTRINLTDIPNCMLGFIIKSDDVNSPDAWYAGKQIESIFKMRNQYRINTATGQYRVEDAEIEITE